MVERIKDEVRTVWLINSHYEVLIQISLAVVRGYIIYLRDQIGLNLVGILVLFPHIPHSLHCQLELSDFSHVVWFLPICGPSIGILKFLLWMTFKSVGYSFQWLTVNHMMIVYCVCAIVMKLWCTLSGLEIWNELHMKCKSNRNCIVGEWFHTNAEILGTNIVLKIKFNIWICEEFN